MKDVMIIVFYGWIAASLSIYVRRLLTNRSLKPGRGRPGARIDSGAAMSVTEASTPVGADPVAIVEGRLESHTGQREVEHPSTGVATLAPGAQSLAEALEGIELPCDLAPLVGAGGMDPRHMAFVTSGVPAETVGSAVADELEKLGYELTPIDDRSISAAKGTTRLEARMHPSRTQAESVLGSLVATAPQDAVIVDVALR